MMIKFVYKILPTLVFYTDRIIPERFGGYTTGILVFIRPKYKDDEGLLYHELTHVRQFYRTLGLHAILYLLSKRYRLKAEIEAYREQLKHPPAVNNPEPYRELYAKFIATKYGLDISEREAQELLR